MTVTPQREQRDLDLVRNALEAEYEVLDELGRGGMAVVYRARDRSLERDVALKVLPFALAFDQDLVQRFQREARTAAQLEHPHIIPIYRVGTTGDVSYFVMKLVRGETLSARLRRTGPLCASEVRRILIETAGALGYAAERGVVHRDIKPDNIMLDERGGCVVTDFGIARSRAEGNLTATGMTLGTPRYMSPEQARAKGVDGRSDLYSLGIVAYECLTGSPPFDGEEAVAILMDHINAPVPRPPLQGDDERALFAVIERMLAKAPKDRFQSAGELVAALRQDGFASRHTGSRPLTPTRPLTSVPAGAYDVDAPSTPLPLDRGLEAGLRLVGAQKQRLGVALTKGRQTAVAWRPHVEAVLRKGAARAAGAYQRTRALSRRAWIAIALAIAAVIGVRQAFHVVTTHRSRCPMPAAATAAGAASETAFTVLLDPVGVRSPAADLDVYYDVCGLPQDTPFSATVTVSRSGISLRRLLGGESVDPLSRSWEDEARSAAVRRHRTMDLDDLPPGSYTLSLIVSDNRGRRRERTVELRIGE